MPPEDSDTLVDDSEETHPPVCFAGKRARRRWCVSRGGVRQGCAVTAASFCRIQHKVLLGT